jgi:hypothetical protein
MLTNPNKYEISYQKDFGISSKSEQAVQKYYHQKIQFSLSWIEEKSKYILLEACCYYKDITEIDKIAEA